MSVRLLADDLTGALDAAVRLAPVAGELPVMWDASLALRSEGAIALSSNTREASPAEAWRVVEGLSGFWREGYLSFKKIDSLWRGNTITEIAALAELGSFSTILVASAFPEQQRMTREGRHYHRANPDDPWSPLKLDSVSEFAKLGIALKTLRPGTLGQIADGGIWMFDAETRIDLDRIVEGGRGAKPPILWCGSAGLAGALGSAAPSSPKLDETNPPFVVVVGSQHPVSRGQVEELARQEVATVFEVDMNRHDWPRLVMRANETLNARKSVVFWYSPHVTLDDDTSNATMSAFFELLSDSLAPPGAIFATGGETLLRLCQASGATQLRPVREVFPGVPLSMVAGGRWGGKNVISKSGAFGARDVIAQILRGSGRP